MIHRYGIQISTNVRIEKEKQESRIKNQESRKQFGLAIPFPIPHSPFPISNFHFPFTIYQTVEQIQHHKSWSQNILFIIFE